MDVILIDDEYLALHYLEKLLLEVSDVKVVGTYTNPHEGLKAVLQKKPSLVFLDIEMPEFNGIMLAERVQLLLPDTRIVFVTAFNEYAVKAFELHAIDYIVKPVQRERLASTFQRVSKEIRPIAVPTIVPKTAMVCAFQSLSFVWDGEVPEEIPTRWRTSKVRGVFAFLLHHRGTIVRKDLLLELFWPEIDSERGFMQLYSTIYQIRKTISSLDFNIVIVNHDSGYRLDLNDVKFEVDEWENSIRDLPSITEETYQQHRSLLDTYRGDYLAAEDYLWAEGERERLRVVWFTQLFTIAKFLQVQKQYPELITLYLRAQTLYPHVDEIYYKLMQLYDSIGNRAKVKEYYSTLEKMLRQEYGTEPRQEIQMRYRNLMS